MSADESLCLQWEKWLEAKRFAVTPFAVGQTDGIKK